MGWGRDIYELVRIPINRPCKGYYLRWYYNGWHYWFFLPGQYSVVTEGEAYRTIGTRTIMMGSGQIDRGQAQAIRTIMNTREVYLLTMAGWMNIRLTPGSLVVYDNRQEGVDIEFEATIGSKEVSYDTGFTPVPGDGSLPEIPVVPTSIDYCERTIGTQIWMCKNWDSAFPGSKVYNNNEENRTIYGGLYTWIMIMSPGFCPVGWHVPFEAEWQTLLDYCGGDALAGGVLKEVGFDHWFPPNTGAVDTYLFSQLGTGYYSIVGAGAFRQMHEYGRAWTDDDGTDPLFARYVRFAYDSAAAAWFQQSKNYYLPVRLIKDTPAPPTNDRVIGTQTWKSINVDDNIAGSRVYNDNEANRPVYGGQYDWSMIAAIEALHPGYHVPTKAEWDILIAFCGGAGLTGGVLKEIGIVHWDAPNTGAVNTHEFTALPGGIYTGVYQLINTDAYFWTATASGAPDAYAYGMEHNSDNILNYNDTKASFLSVRLIKD